MLFCCQVTLSDHLLKTPDRLSLVGNLASHRSTLSFESLVLSQHEVHTFVSIVLHGLKTLSYQVTLVILDTLADKLLSLNLEGSLLLGHMSYFAQEYA